METLFKIFTSKLENMTGVKPDTFKVKKQLNQCLDGVPYIPK